jgi:predicted ribosomally synthesized peptide with SipW-like signal peptide
MRKILLSAFIVLGAGAALASGATGAFFSDTESSTGNTFAAGAIDLKIDNDSYYNGNRCTFLGEQATSSPGFYWQGPNAYPPAGSPCNTSFPESDLDDGLVFFNFLDLKPDDEGEDTISIHVQNDAWACMDLTLTSDDDNSSTEPELATGDPEDVDGDAWDGELANAIQMFWWADDGDNVYEEGEQDLSGGVKTLTDLATTTGSFSITLADMNGNAWGGQDPLPANQTVYIAKAWCMGALTPAALAQDGAGTDGPQAPGREGGGFTCNGTLLGNETQTDSVEMTLMFRAEQARNNPNFKCNPPRDEDRFGTLTVNKALLVSTAGIEVNDFTLHIVGPNGDMVVTDEVPVPNLPAGMYQVYEHITGNVGGHTFTTTFSGACTSGGGTPTSTPFALAANDNITCNILNNQVGDGIGD